MRYCLNIMRISVKDNWNNRQARMLNLVLVCVVVIIKLAFLVRSVATMAFQNHTDMLSQILVKGLQITTFGIAAAFLICYLIISIIKIQDMKKQLRLFRTIGYQNWHIACYLASTWGVAMLGAIVLGDILITAAGFGILQWLQIGDSGILTASFLHSNQLLLCYSLLLFLMQYAVIRVGQYVCRNR